MLLTEPASDKAGPGSDRDAVLPPAAMMMPPMLEMPVAAMLRPVPTPYSVRPAFQRLVTGPGRISASSVNDTTLRGTMQFCVGACSDKSTRGGTKTGGAALGSGRDADGVDVDAPVDAAAVPVLELAFEVEAGAGAEAEVDVVADGAVGVAAGAAADVEAADADGVAAGGGVEVEAAAAAGAAADPEVEVLVDAGASVGCDLDFFELECLLASTAVALSPMHSRAAKIRCSMRPNFRRTHMVRISPICPLLTAVLR